MGYTNAQMESMVEALAPQLERKDVIGYAAARNTRILRGELVEYMVKRDELVAEYGEPVVDGDGKETGEIAISNTSPNFSEFIGRFGEFAAIEHEPDIFRLKYEVAIGELSGSELLELDWMFED